MIFQCTSRTFLFTTAVFAIALVVEGCKKNEYKCRDGSCISINKYCNELPDCQDGSDEFPNCSPCNMTYYGTVGTTYELEIKKPTEQQIPFLCHLNFTGGGGSFGELVQLSFESFAVGTFESFTTGGCPDGYISIKEANRPASGGKWCGSAWGYTVYYSETNSINLTLSLTKFPQEQTSGYNFEFKVSYKFLRLSDARIRYGNASQRSYRGKLTSGSYCDRLLEGCSRRPCRIQSPNYPGIYPRNVSCHYRVRERNIPDGKHALITLRQANFHYKELPVSKFDNADNMLRIWDQCNMMQDYIEILDGWGPSATTLAHLCSGETIPEIISSGPELLVKFHTSAFGNPFHPLPLSYLPGFELEVEVIYVNKESPTYIEHGKKCEFLVTTFDNTTGLLESPLHSLPPNTTCHYHFRGQAKDIIWISFIKYHVTNERLTDFNMGPGQCDVKLQIWDGDIKSTNNVQLIGQFCKEDKPKLCDHSLLKNSSRLTRPCGLAESYVSTSSDLTISHSIKYGSVLYPVNFVLRYEFVDLSQEGQQISRNPCDRLFMEKLKKGRFYSPKITFLFGRGGKKDLTCTYQFESNDPNKSLRITLNKALFGDKNCTSEYDTETNRWMCFNSGSRRERGSASIQISEFPWQNVEMKRDCFCNNIYKPVTVVTKTAHKVSVTFSVTDMKITEDYRHYLFDANFEFISKDDNYCLNNESSHRLRGTSGEINIKSPDQNSTSSICHHQPWLIEPEEESNFIYLKVKGNKRDTRLCASNNRIIIYRVGQTDKAEIICPDSDEDVELFSDGWYQQRKPQYSRSFVVEIHQREPGNFLISWIEISKNPALLLPTSLLMISAPECHSCPELGACISSDLWCDGLNHCPSGNDETESNCLINRGFPLTYLNSIVLVVIAVTLLIMAAIVGFYLYRQWKNQQKNVIVSVTEHTFLEFKSGLC